MLYLTTGSAEYSKNKDFCAELDVFSRTVLTVWKKSSRRQVHKEKHKSDFQIMIGEKRLPTTGEVRAILADKAVMEKVRLYWTLIYKLFSVT